MANTVKETFSVEYPDPHGCQHQHRSYEAALRCAKRLLRLSGPVTEGRYNMIRIQRHTTGA